MNDEVGEFFLDIHWFKNECNVMGLDIQNDDTCDLFAEMVANKFIDVRDVGLARLIVFSDLMGIK